MRLQSAPLALLTQRRGALPATAAPGAFHVVVSTIVSPDRLDVLLRQEAATLVDAKALAVQLLVATAERCGACCVDVVDGRGCPVYFASTAGGAL